MTGHTEDEQPASAEAYPRRSLRQEARTSKQITNLISPASGQRAGTGSQCRNQAEIPNGSEWIVIDRTEGRHHDVGPGVSHALAHPGLKIHRGERLAAHVAGKIAGPDKNDIFMFNEKELRCSR